LSPDEDDITMEEAVGHFVSRAENKMRELTDAGTFPPTHAFLPREELRAAGKIAQLPWDPHDTGRISQLAQPGGAGAHIADLSPPPVGPPGAALPPANAADGGSTPQIPQLQIFVHLTDARTVYERAMETALDRKTPTYREIAEQEVRRGFFRYECERRAADYRLRGPG
jgi:hypothetical protein